GCGEKSSSSSTAAPRRRSGSRCSRTGSPCADATTSTSRPPRRGRSRPCAGASSGGAARARRAARVSVRARMRQFEQALRERGLKSTSQGDDIARVFFAAEQHLSIEQLYTAVRRVNPRVGYATVYRTLKLLKECGLAAERPFDDGQPRYEPVEGEAQHDHIICERCGKIVEFASDELERLQDKIRSGERRGGRE